MALLHAAYERLVNAIHNEATIEAYRSEGRRLVETLCATGIVSLYAVTFACNSIYHFAFFGPLPTSAERPVGRSIATTGTERSLTSATTVSSSPVSEP